MENVFRLDDIPFPLLIKDTMDSRFTGIIFVSCDNLKKGLIFKDGLLCAIQSNSTDELLGNILVSMGTITDDENNKSIELAQIERRKQGVILLEMGIIQPKEITEALKKQLQKRFLDIFSWEHGTIQKVEKAQIDKAPDITRTEFSQLVRQGIMDYTPFSSIITALSPFADAHPKKLVENMPKDMGVIIDNVDQYKVSELLLLGQDPPRALLCLYCTGIVSFEESQHKALIDKLRQVLKMMKDQDPFDILGVDRSISEGGLKRAYIKIVKQNHPDTYSYADDPEVKRLANEIFTVIQKAHTSVLRIREGKPPEEKKEMDESLQAELFYSQATEALREKDYRKALDLFKLSVKMKPDEKVFMESYVNTMFLSWQNTGKGSTLEIKSAIREGTKRFPNSDIFYVILGWILKKEGSKRAVDAFRKALQINKNNVDAQRELRLIQMRTKK
ncbi:MAG: DnaJ domain-containing protein [Deltaproteobacteria bacterium]|nr:DnaJ domain-containing protein [Deltaproteobacteria bacterium]